MCISPKGGGKITQHVSFSRPFDKTPTVLLSVETGVPENVNVSADSITNDGFDIVHVRNNDTGTHVNWIAFAK